MRVVAIVGIVLLAGGLSQAGEKGAAAGSGNALQVLTQSKLEVGDVPGHELAQAINRLACEPTLRQQFGIQGRKRVIAHFSWDSIAQRTIELYRSLIECR